MGSERTRSCEAEKPDAAQKQKESTAMADRKAGICIRVFPRKVGTTDSRKHATRQQGNGLKEGEFDVTEQGIAYSSNFGPIKEYTKQT